MSQLAARSGVPVATIKFYRREGLLAAGTASASNQAEYGEAHVDRLQLIRSLREVADLPIAAIREILAAVDDPTRSIHQVVGVAHAALDPGGVPVAHGDGARADEVIAAAGWQVSAATPARTTLARALRALDELGMPTDPGVLERYVAAADRIAAAEVAATLGDGGNSREAVVTSVVVGTVLFEQVLNALRRLAQEHHSARRG